MSSEFDYTKLGLKCGLEIHQQLDTKKLFCDCPSLLRSDEPNFSVSRKLHSVAGESGEIDIAVKYQSEKDQEFLYQGYDTTCLVELDEEPPHEINIHALKIGLQISELLNCQVLKYSQIMRKTVVDGSNTSGFQRTVLIAKDGYIETEKGRVRIDSVALEEDAARVIERSKTGTVYRLDRLGIPLVEIATAPDITTPEQCKEAALKIGEILRACKVKRGIGTIRQDVNMSIAKGNRTEIKGVQEPALIMKTINSEIERQLKIIEGKEKIEKEVRKANADGSTEYLRPLPGAARMYPETDLPLLKISRELLNEVKNNLPKLKSEYRDELKKDGLNEELIKLILDYDKIAEFKELNKSYNMPVLIAKMLTLFSRELASKNEKSVEDVDKILSEYYNDILNDVKKGRISESDVKGVMEKLLSGESLDKALSVEKHDVHELEEKIMKIIKDKPGLSENAYMGLIMKEFKGKADGKLIMELIKKHKK